MKVVHLNTNATGGAAAACIRLHRALLKAGVDSRVLTLRGPQGDDPRIQSMEAGMGARFRVFDMLNRVRNRLPLIGKPYHFFSGPYSFFHPENHPWVKEADIINLHWVAKFVDYTRFFETGRSYVWTLHDYQPFSGGFHYPGGMDAAAYARLIKQNETVKIRALKGKKLIPVAPSAWLAALAADSRVFQPFGCRHIPNCLDTALFAPADRSALCRELGWPEDKKVLLFLAENLNETRKGFHLLTAALRGMSLDNVLLAAVGRSPEGLDGIPFVHIPFTSRETELARVYAAADVYVTPSLEDNLPNTVLEALACGTPVVAFQTGGIPEMVQHGHNGWICETATAQSLQSGLEHMLFDADLAAMSLAAVNGVREQFSEASVAAAYLALYRSALA